MINDLSGMWLIFLEAGVALALLVFIVWWTWPAKTRKPDEKDTRHD